MSSPLSDMLSRALSDSLGGASTAPNLSPDEQSAVLAQRYLNLSASHVLQPGTVVREKPGLATFGNKAGLEIRWVILRRFDVTIAQDAFLATEILKHRAEGLLGWNLDWVCGRLTGQSETLFVYVFDANVIEPVPAAATTAAAPVPDDLPDPAIAKPLPNDAALPTTA